MPIKYVDGKKIHLPYPKQPNQPKQPKQPKQLKKMGQKRTRPPVKPKPNTNKYR